MDGVDEGIWLASAQPIRSPHELGMELVDRALGRACVDGPSRPSIAFRSRSESSMPPLGSQNSSRGAEGEQVSRRSPAPARPCALRGRAGSRAARPGACPSRRRRGRRSNGSAADDLPRARPRSSARSGRHSRGPPRGPPRSARSIRPSTRAGPRRRRCRSPGRSRRTRSRAIRTRRRRSALLIRRLPRFIPRRKAASFSVRLQSTGPAVSRWAPSGRPSVSWARGRRPAAHRGRRPVSIPISWSIETRSSEEMLPVEPAGTGQPPSSPKLDSNESMPCPSAASALARPWPRVLWKWAVSSGLGRRRSRAAA